MQIEPFELERWQSVWENKVELNISESGVHPLTTAELVPDPEQLRKILDVQQLYPQTNGSEELRSRIAELYPGTSAENVLVTCGGSEANYVSTWSLIEPGDEVVFMMPNYMQIAGVARAMGATVKPLWLREALDWGINVDDLPRVVTPKTKLIAICNPSNPTGAVLRDDMRAAVVVAAEKVGAWIISDEVYRGAEFDGETDGDDVGRIRAHVVHGGAFESVQPAGAAHGMGDRGAENDREAVELSRLHQHRAFDVDGPAGFGGAGAGAARMDFESHAGTSAAQLPAAAGVAGRACGNIFARGAEGRRDCVGGIARRQEFGADGGRIACEEKRAAGAWRAGGDGRVRAVWIRRRAGTFAEGAGAD